MPLINVKCQRGIAGRTGRLDLLFAILEQNINNNNAEDSKKSLKYVLISCSPTSSTSIFFPCLLLLCIKYPLRYSSMDSSVCMLGTCNFEWTSPSCCGPNLKIVKNAADQSLRTLWKPQKKILLKKCEPITLILNQLQTPSTQMKEERR